MKKIIFTFLLNLVCLLSFGASWEGAGTEDDPYQISVPGQLAELSDKVNDGNDFLGEYFSLANDIDLSEFCGDSVGNWNPIGSLYHYFEGVFLGNNYTISNLYMDNDGETSYYGLFGYIGESGAVYDLKIDSAEIFNHSWTGGIAGANNGLISNCKVVNSTIRGWQFVGGVCGVNFNTIENCVNQSDVTSSLCSGGICAYNYGSIIGCSNLGGITANSDAGGICGYNGGFAGISNCFNVKVGYIDNCDNSAFILGEDMIGGVSGRNDGFIVNSMNAGDIYGFQQTGGLVGYNGGFDGVVGIISNSFNTGDVTGRDTLVGGVVGYGNEYSEIFNVYTINDVHCVNSNLTDLIGEENGIKDNCYIVYANTDTTDLDSVENNLNQWVDLRPDSLLYFGWIVKNNYIYSMPQDSLSTLPDSLEKPRDTLALSDSPMEDPDQFSNVSDIKSLDVLKVFFSIGKFYMISQENKSISIYSADGKLVRSVNLSAGVMTMIPLNRGVYLVDNRKVVVY